MSVFENFYYAKQLKKYIIQIMAIFANMEVEVGASAGQERRTIKVPIANASKDRVVGWIKGDQSQNKPIRIPMFSLTLTNLILTPELRKGIGVGRRNTYMPIGGVFPTDFKVVEQQMPVPYKANFELGIWASNQDQHYQIIEQILMLFDPILQIQTSDDPFDWTRLTTVELTGINFGENVPAGAERRLIQTTLTFDVPIWLACPSNIRNNYIERIFMRIGAVNDLSSNIEIITELNNEDVAYVEIFNDQDVDLEEN